MQLNQEIVSIRAARAGRDRCHSRVHKGRSSFYPRGPCGPRLLESGHQLARTRFYPRGPCGPRPNGGHRHKATAAVSIRAARAGRDRAGIYNHHPAPGFLSARPVRAATSLSADVVRLRSVSIRAARAGRDRQPCYQALCPHCFYPRGPCGPRPSRMSKKWAFLAFLSARPVRAATVDGTADDYQAVMFLSARPVRAATRGHDEPMAAFCSFYPRGPCGPRHNPLSLHTSPSCFYPRGPCGPRP